MTSLCLGSCGESGSEEHRGKQTVAIGWKLSLAWMGAGRGDGEGWVVEWTGLADAPERLLGSGGGSRFQPECCQCRVLPAALRAQQ